VRRTLLTLFVIVPSLALASGYSLPNTNPRDLGVSASAVAAQNDSGAAFAMPAALARLGGPSVRLGGGGVTIMSNWKDPAPTPTPASSNATSVDLKTSITPIGGISASYGGELDLMGKRGWGVGLGVQPFGGSVVEWPKDWPGQYRITKVNRQVFSGILSAGVELLPMVRVGGGLLYYYTMETFEQNAFLPSPPLPAAYHPTAKLDANGGALSFDASLEVDPIPNVPLTVAVDYKHQAVQTLDGKAKWTGLPPFPIPAALGGALLQNQGVKQNLTIPNTLNVGVSYRVTKPLLVMATYTFDRWSVYQKDTFYGDVPGAVINVVRNYSDGWTLRGGVEYDVVPAFQVRAGVQRDHSGLDEAHYSPTLPDASSWAGSLGATYKFGRGLSLDGGVFYAMMDEIKVKNAAAAEFPPSALPLRGTYKTSALVWGLSVGWTPGQK
jgi:long-chain fatty acid transport protein